MSVPDSVEGAWSKMVGAPHMSTVEEDFGGPQ